jgi:hypothetical protein
MLESALNRLGSHPFRSWLPSGPALYESESASQPSEFALGGRCAAAIVYLLNTICETTVVKGQCFKQSPTAVGLDKQVTNSAEDLCQFRGFYNATSSKGCRTSVKSMAGGAFSLPDFHPSVVLPDSSGF